MESQGINTGTFVEPPAGEAVAPDVWLAWKRFAVLAGGLAILWILPLASVFKLALKSDIHSHILLIPFVAAYVAWTERGNIRVPGQPMLWLAVLLGVASGGAVLTARALPAFALSLQVFGFTLAVAAAGAATLGRRLLWANSFAFSFLLFMVPLPGPVIDACEMWLQRVSATAAEWYFLATGFSHIREGQIFQLPGLTIEVAQECSGFRSTLVLVVVSIVAARLFLQAFWRRFIIFAVIIPLGVLRNGFRIWVLSVLTVNVDKRIIDSPLHSQGGPIFFVLSLIPLFLLVWFLYRSERGLRRARLESKLPKLAGAA